MPRIAGRVRKRSWFLPTAVVLNALDDEMRLASLALGGQCLISYDMAATNGTLLASGALVWPVQQVPAGQLQATLASGSSRWSQVQCVGNCEDDCTCILE